MLSEAELVTAIEHTTDVDAPSVEAGLSLARSIQLSNDSAARIDVLFAREVRV